MARPRPRRCSQAVCPGDRDLKARGGYRTADVIDVRPDTPNLDAMLAKFSREHWHDEDEVRFIVEGRGLFHVHPADGPVFAIEVEAGDLIRVPRGTHHWFDLCADRRIRAIRLFQDHIGLDAPLHRHGHRPAVSTSLLRSVVRARRRPCDRRGDAAGIRAILLDIEGTTTPIAFVHEVLFPYARRNLRRHLEQHASSPEYDSLLDRFRDEHAGDRVTGQAVPPWVEAPHAARLAAVVSLQ